MSDSTEISIVIPVYKSAEIFPELHARLTAALSPVTPSFEIIAVVDGDLDRSAEVVAEINGTDPRTRLIEFSRNFGHQAAVTAGLKYSSGEMVIVMDDDLEDPPEVLPDLIARAREGYDVVYCIRKKRKVSFIKRLMFDAFYRLLNKLADIEMPYDAGDFCLMRRPVVDRINALPENNRYIRGLRTWVGFKQTGFEYERGQRLHGESGYSLTKYVKLAMDGIISFSYKPLAYVGLSGFFMAGISFLLLVWVVCLRLMGRIENVPGWTFIVVSILFLGSVQLISIGVIGQYVGRIYEEVKQRPNFVIKKTQGFE